MSNMELPDQGAIDETTKSSQQESLSQAAPKRNRSESDLVEAALREKKVPTAQREAFGEIAGTVSLCQASGGGSQSGGAVVAARRGARGESNSGASVGRLEPVTDNKPSARVGDVPAIVALLPYSKTGWGMA